MSTKRTRVLVLICSTRPGALGPAVGKWLTETLAPSTLTLDAAPVPLALGDLRLPFLDEEEHPRPASTGTSTRAVGARSSTRPTASSS